MAEPWQRLGGKVVMVTGASSGIGLEISLDLARAGCRVIVAARRIERLKSLCDQINKGMASSTVEKAAAAVMVELDVAAEGKDIEKGVQRAWEAFGHIDALINNAGYRGYVRSSLDTYGGRRLWQQTPRLVSKYVGVRMRDANLRGSIINVGINRGAFHGSVAYSASKSAMVMAIELGQYGIRVNALAIGLFRSEITEKLLETRGEMVKSFLKRTVPLKTMGSTDPAMTSLVRYLLNDAAEYVTGNVFIVDAGATLTGIPIFSSLSTLRTLLIFNYLFPPLWYCPNNLDQACH